MIAGNIGNHAAGVLKLAALPLDCGACPCGGDDHPLHIGNPEKQPDRRAPRHTGISRREKTLVHVGVAENQKPGRQDDAGSLHPADRPKEHQVVGGKHCRHPGVPARLPVYIGKRDENADDHRNPHGQVRVGDREHPCQRGIDDDEDGDDDRGRLHVETRHGEIQHGGSRPILVRHNRDRGQHHCARPPADWARSSRPPRRRPSGPACARARRPPTPRRNRPPWSRRRSLRPWWRGRPRVRAP